MNVLIVTPWYPHKENSASGIFIQDIARAVSLYATPAVVHIHSSKDAKRPISMEEFEDKKLKVYRINIKSLPGKLHSPLYMGVLLYLLKICREFKPDVIHSHVFTAGLFSVIAGKLTSIPVIQTEHMLFNKGNGDKKVDFIRRFIGRVVLDNTSFVTTPSNFFKRYLKSSGVHNRIKTVPNTVDTDFFRPPNSKEKKGVSSFLFAGWVDPIKGFDVLLSAIKDVSSKRDDFNLIVAGGGRFLEEYKNKSRFDGTYRFVKFLGSQKREKIPHLMQSCDFLVLPSRWEVFGVVVVEALACGKPAIVSDKGQREIINHKTGVVVRSENVQMLSESIEYMIENHRKFPQNYIRKHALKYSYESVGKIFAELYREVSRSNRG